MRLLRRATAKFDKRSHGCNAAGARGWYSPSSTNEKIGDYNARCERERKRERTETLSGSLTRTLGSKWFSLFHIICSKSNQVGD